MKKKIGFLLLLILITTIGISAHVFVISKVAKRSGNLVINATPDGTVFVNSNAEGRTPLTVELSPGKYNVKIIPNSLDPAKVEKTAVPWEGKVEIFEGFDTFVRRQLEESENESSGEVITLIKSQNNLEKGKGEVQVKSVPEGAIVSVDGQDLGVTPDSFSNISSGIHDVSVYATRFKRRSIQVQVIDGYATVAEFTLGIDPDFEKNYPFGAAFEASSSATLPSVPKTTREPTPTKIPEKVEILDTPTGFLRVRLDPSLAGKEISQVKPGETYPYISEENRWTKIKLTDGNEGWVSSDYVKEIK